jgi:hypothetical protein
MRLKEKSEELSTLITGRFILIVFGAVNRVGFLPAQWARCIVFLGFSPTPRSLFSKALPHFRVVIGTLVFFHQLFPITGCL